mgnify:CR=1 FL=1
MKKEEDKLEVSTSSVPELVEGTIVEHFETSRKKYNPQNEKYNFSK